MSVSHFIKHLRCYYQTISRRLASRNLIRSSTPLFFTGAGTGTGAAASLHSSSSESSSSHYLSVRIHCPKQVADSLSDALLCFGASSVSVDVENATDASEMRIDSIFPVHEQVKKCISLAANSIGLKEILEYEVETGDEQDWLQKSQESFHPVEVTEGLWIVPEWTIPPVLEATNIILNPGLAFGTGEHPTTKLCLLLLKSLIKGEETFLDYGTGSGVLAIAALKFGAASSVGIDIDPVAITSARHNATLNNIPPDRLQFHLVSGGDPHEAEKEEQSFCGEGVSLGREKFDVVVANILLNPLLELADAIVSYVKPGGSVGISGILSEQVPDIIERYSQFLDSISVSGIDDWACLSGKKKKF